MAPLTAPRGCNSHKNCLLDRLWCWKHLCCHLVLLACGNTAPYLKAMAQGIAARTNVPSKSHLTLKKLVMVAACLLITKKMKSNKLILEKDHAGIAAESLTQLQEICKYIKKSHQQRILCGFFGTQGFQCHLQYPLEAETKKKAAATASY